jgi:hypothetical protein
VALVDLFPLSDLDSFLRGTTDPAAGAVARRIATSLLTSYLGTDPRPDDAPTSRTIQLDVDSDATVRLPRLLTGIVSVKSGINDVTYVRRGNVITVRAWGPMIWQYASAGPSIDLTYTYTSVPDQVRDAALIVAAEVYGPLDGSHSGIAQEQIDDYLVRYSDSSGEALPEAAKLLLRPFRWSVRSARLVSPESGPRYSTNPGSWL